MPNATANRIYGRCFLIENLLDNIGNIANVSARAPAKQPVNIPPNRLNAIKEGVPSEMGILNISTTFPNVTPRMISSSMRALLFKALYFSASLSNTPRRVINATYPAAVAPPAVRQNKLKAIVLVNIQRFFIPYTVYNDALVDILFVESHLNLKGRRVICYLCINSVVKENYHSYGKSQAVAD